MGSRRPGPPPQPAKPVLIGFGIDTPGRAAAAARHADGVIVASALMRQVLDGASAADICRGPSRPCAPPWTKPWALTRADAA